MSILEEPSVGLRELRHHTSEVISRVRRVETIEVTEHGTPIGARESLTRNLLRLIDFLPGFYVLGGIVAIASSRSQRGSQLGRARSGPGPGDVKMSRRAHLVSLADGHERGLRHAREDTAARLVPRISGTQAACRRPYTTESYRACQLASMMFSETPIVVQVDCPSVESTRTRVTAPVPLPVSSTLTR